MSTSFTRRLVALSVAALAVVAIGGTALAGHLTSGVKSYTGCLSISGGVVTKVKEGDLPKTACSSGETLVHLSGGDISKVSVTGGLTGGGDNGELTIGLDPKYSLPQSCTAPNNVAKFNGTAWVCAGDNDTRYLNGTGLDLTGTEFSVDEEYRVKNTPDCSAGQFATGFDGDGEIECAAPSSGGPEVWQMRRASTTSSATSIPLPKGEGVDLLIMPLPAGTYLVTAVATVGDRDGTARGDEEVAVDCRLRNLAFAGLPINESFVEIGEESADDGPAGTAVIHGILPLASPETVRFTCFSREGDSEEDQATNVSMTAMKIGTLHSP